MSVLGLGVDIVEIGRMAAVLERRQEPFLRRLGVVPEAVAALRPERLATHVTGLFAAKEAALKALGTGWAEGLAPRQVGIVADELGAPRIRLRDAALARAERMGVTAIHLSITHERRYAVAVVVLEGRAAMIGS